MKEKKKENPEIILLSKKDQIKNNSSDIPLKITKKTESCKNEQSKSVPRKGKKECSQSSERELVKENEKL